MEGDNLIDMAEEMPPKQEQLNKDTSHSQQEKGPEKSNPDSSHIESEQNTLDSLAESVATIRPSKTDNVENPPKYLDIEQKYVDPTPPTPYTSNPPSRSPSATASHRNDASPTRSDVPDDERRYASEDEQENGSRAEIQNIMGQFATDGGGPGEEEVMSPRLEIASPMLATPPQQHPPRKSSLEPLSSGISHHIQELQGLRLSSGSPASMRSREQQAPTTSEDRPAVPPKDLSQSQISLQSRVNNEGASEIPMSPSSSMHHRPPPPEPEPEPTQPFDFHRFLEQLRNKKADPVARYLKSFLSEFGKKQWMVHEQVKIISDFLAFIANKMVQCDVWRNATDAEFDNAREGMEKLVMNRLYTQTFSPAIHPPQPIPGAKPKRKGGERPMGPGRKGQHQEDVERDEIVTQKIKIYSWVRERHLDISPVGDSGRKFLKLAQQELLKIKSYRAPRDKIICVLNCCKVIFGLLKHAKSDSSADSFMPLLIYVVLQANPEHLVSNVQYILRFRNQEKLGGEAGYYLSSLMGVIQFIESMDKTTLTITDEEFENNVEAAVSAIAEKHHNALPMPPEPSEKSPTTLDPPSDPTRASYDSEAIPRRSMSSADGTDSSDERAALTGILKTIQKPLTSIGRIFSEDAGPSGYNSPARTPQLAGSTPARPSPRPSVDDPAAREHAQHSRHHQMSAEEAAARQASAETAEAQRLQRAEHANVVETLAGMFPDLDREIISDVVYQKQGSGIVGMDILQVFALISEKIETVACIDRSRRSLLNLHVNILQAVNPSSQLIMCGILFSLSKTSSFSLSPEHRNRLSARGPDHLGQVEQTIDRANATQLHLSVASTVLALRGDHLVKQPLTDTASGSLLCWNGEAWKWAGQPISQNDGEVIFSHLLQAASCQSPDHDAILACLRAIEGPFAFVFFYKPSQTVYYGRDRLGRRSLLIGSSLDSLVICSIADYHPGDEGKWEEVEADGIYSFDLSSSSSNAPEAVLAEPPRRDFWAVDQNGGQELVSSLGAFNASTPTEKNTLEACSSSVGALSRHLEESLGLRVLGIPDPPAIRSRSDSRVAVLFSGGLDCTVLARMAHDKVPSGQTIDLLNVAFENPRVAAQLKANPDGSLPNIYEVCPDRITGRKSFQELTKVCHSRTWRFVTINVPYRETIEHRAVIISLMYPHNTEMDLSIAYALYFSSRGTGVAQVKPSGPPEAYSTNARVLLSGLGADELFGGYSRHATAFSRYGYPGLIEELKLDVSRLGKRNLGRDDRVISHWGREVRFPYLDETFVKWAVELPAWEKCDFENVEREGMPEPGKRVLRFLAERLGMAQVAREKKRAIQFGSRTAKMETGKTKGTHPIS
ncbi:Vacuolar protein sorting-associated protein 9a [Zalerion maritima]|uniref:Vacuolar protein sorting-associated protein 9a n=1 Tax=Zalerion maritima TaxID=339359 RepID=A0AAD5WTI4_9PEZI|nr:Vacuolar protein sorting-associated protein 9a [Zalerion maritima]